MGPGLSPSTILKIYPDPGPSYEHRIRNTASLGIRQRGSGPGAPPGLSPSMIPGSDWIRILVSYTGLSTLLL